MAGEFAPSAAISLRLTWNESYYRTLREASGARADLRREIRKSMREIGRVVQRVFRSQFGARMTDPRSRRRTDRGERLGIFSGTARRAIGIRTKFDEHGWKTFVGPRGGAGIQGPGFYLAFHEFGSKALRRRATAAIAERLTRSEVLRELEAATDRILTGWRL